MHAHDNVVDTEPLVELDDLLGHVVDGDVRALLLVRQVGGRGG